MYIMQVSKSGFQIKILRCHSLFHNFSCFLLTSFLPIHNDWSRLSVSEGHCREKTDLHSQGSSNKWHVRDSSQMLALWTHIRAGQFKLLPKGMWLSGCGSILNKITTHNQRHTLYFLSSSVGHDSLAASKRNGTWTSLSKGRSFDPCNPTVEG